MNLSQRLRTCAKHTGLDAVIDLLNEAADEIDALHARTNGQATQPAEVTLDEVMQAAKEATAPEWQDVVDGWHMGLDLMAFARAILALRPVQVPMTPTERERELDRSPVDASWEAGDAFMEGIYAAEAHHGITAQAKKEGA